MQHAAIVLLSLSLAPAAPPVALAAPAVETADGTACAITGWSADNDPAGLNVRAAPRLDAPVIGRIPPPRDQAGDSYAAEFEITASRGGWFLIRHARFADYGGGKGDRVVFAGPGWVYADKVRFLINRAELRAAPDPAASVVARLTTPDGGGPDSASIDHVLGCAGPFAEVVVHMARRPPVHGWASGVCSNQVTTCP